MRKKTFREKKKNVFFPYEAIWELDYFSAQVDASKRAEKKSNLKIASFGRGIFTLFLEAGPKNAETSSMDFYIQLVTLNHRLEEVIWKSMGWFLRKKKNLIQTV